MALMGVILSSFLFQMDGSAVIYSPDKFLVQLGLERKGDLYALRSFCERKEKTLENRDREERKQILIEKLRQKRRPGTSATSTSTAATGSNNKERYRKFEIGWLHYSEDRERYIAVRQPTGGGTRSVSMLGESTTTDILLEARRLFFPQGESSFGKWHEMNASLANFKGETVSREFISHEGNKISFTLKSYFEFYKLTRVRLYLRTRRKEESAQLEKENGDKKKKEESEAATDLIGTSADRAVLKDVQDREYTESLKADRLKVTQRNEALMEESRKAKEIEDIHTARLARVLEEPGIDEPRTVVCVRHIDMGPLKRAFKPSQTMAAVYDWIGSLQLIPPFFTLSNAPGCMLDPSLPITCAEKVLFMEKSEEPVSLSSEDLEINFKGFGPLVNSAKAESLQIAEIGSNPPYQLMAGDTDDELERNLG